jgi:hypothetical protein
MWETFSERSFLPASLFSITIMIQIPQAAQVGVWDDLSAISACGPEKQINAVSVVIVCDKSLNRLVSEPLLGLRLPSKDSVGSNTFLKLVIRLLLPKGNEEDPVTWAIRQLNKPVEAPRPGLGSELGTWVEEVVDLLP